MTDKPTDLEQRAREMLPLDFDANSYLAKCALRAITKALASSSVPEQRRESWASAAHQDRAAAHAMLSICNDIMATVLASAAPDGGRNDAGGKLDRICAKIELIRQRAQRSLTEAREVLSAEMCEASLASVPEQDSWQPIETAPKDERIIGAYFGPDKSFYSAASVMRFFQWETMEKALASGWHYPVEPTHWMPLPPPPEAPQDRGASQEDGQA